MKNKNISYRSSDLLSKLNESGKTFFSVKDAVRLLKITYSSSILELLSAMTRRGLIMRIKDGLYHIIPYEKNSNEYFPNWHLTAEALAGEREYYLGFYTALDIHGLLTQPSLVEQIVVKKRVIPQEYKVKNVKFEIITYNNSHFFGFKKIWIDDYNKINCSDIEKTIIDCLYKPNYANGINELIKALYKISEKINSEKMIRYLEMFDAQVVYKRLGFILQNLGIQQTLTKEIKALISNSYTSLDPSLPQKGKHNSDWKILDNIEISSAIKSIET
jgi:predicted transcriptional regulator of viral defense system